MEIGCQFGRCVRHARPESRYSQNKQQRLSLTHHLQDVHNYKIVNGLFLLIVILSENHPTQKKEKLALSKMKI